MNISNLLTLVRVVLIPVFMALFFSDFPYGNYLAAIVFGVAALTDTFDGYLARLRRETTKIGEILDPFADKMLVSAALISLVEAQKLRAWFAVVIIAREFLVSALRTLTHSKGMGLPASKLGKTKTFFQIIAILLCVVFDKNQLSLNRATGLITWFFLAGALVLTVYSAYDYLRSTILMMSKSESSKGEG
ncbi:MAG: CDP-diacylglycerol--glycerol-3-phosphate 3-phosphatidyltransferase [Actinobacteria bacterium]|nr:CDP-diacylglycerol--glycerol-3-phosphate 3-phosphatidyltransferase [Actinomycetota bacterium]